MLDREYYKNCELIKSTINIDLGSLINDDVIIFRLPFLLKRHINRLCYLSGCNQSELIRFLIVRELSLSIEINKINGGIENA